MRIAARLALHAPNACPQSGAQSAAGGGASAFPQFDKHLTSYHGCDVVVREISEAGFEASINGLVPEDSVVRLRLPGAGVLLARVAEAQPGWLRCTFVNPVSPSRLRMTLGMGQIMPRQAVA
jgi:hypothetical protein